MVASFNGITQARTHGIDPYTNDRSPLVSVDIDGVTYDKLNHYAYDSDILQLGDPASVVIPDPHQNIQIHEGDPFILYFADPDVSGGKRLQQLKGIVTDVDAVADSTAGTIINVAAADLGWHLVNNDAPIWKRLAGRTFGGLYTLLVDSTWGFSGFTNENDSNIKAKMGGNYARATAQLGDTDKPPIVQIEPGDKPADILIQFAKLANKLVNVTNDGKIALFSPNYTSPIAYRFYHYRNQDTSHIKNNVLKARLKKSLSSRWTKSICVGTRYIPLVEGVDPNDPNANNFRGTYTPSPRPLSFNRLTAFADPDRLNRDAASARARWKIQRGDFDAWTYEITVRGHSQDGRLFCPDTMCEVQDAVLGVEGKYYVSAIRMNRDDATGTTTTLTIKKPNLLAA